MRKRFLMVVALMVALTFPLRVSALAAGASEELPVDASMELPVEASEVQPVEAIPDELSSCECYFTDDISFLSQTYSVSSGISFTFIHHPEYPYPSGTWVPHIAEIHYFSDVLYYPYYSSLSSDTSFACIYYVQVIPSGGFYLYFDEDYIRNLWSFIAVLCLSTDGYTFGGGGSGDSIDYTAILNQIVDKLNAIQSGNSSDLSEVTQLLNQVVTSNASVQQAVNDMHSALVSVITSTNSAVDNLGDELQQRFDDAMTTLDEGLTAQSQVLQDMTGRMDSMETALKDSVGGSFQIDDSASGSVDSVGTEGFEVISSTLDQMLSSFSWISALVGVFLMIVLAKRILT